MPRPLFMNKEQNSEKSILSLSSDTQNVKKIYLESPKDRERILRQKRSKEYIDFLTKLDTGSVDAQTRINAVLEEVRKEFPLIEIPGDFVGYCSKCYLGKEYEVHMVDFAGYIIEHFKVGQPMPGVMENARSLAMDEHYELIEVYTKCIRTVDENGNVSVIPI